MRKILRWFSLFREMEQRVEGLEDTIDKMGQDLSKAETEKELLLQRVSELDRRLEESHANEIAAREVLADFLSVQHTGKPIFNVAPDLPREGRSQEPIYNQRVQGRKYAAQKRRQFFEAVRNASNG